MTEPADYDAPSPGAAAAEIGRLCLELAAVRDTMDILARDNIRHRAALVREMRRAEKAEAERDAPRAELAEALATLDRFLRAENEDLADAEARLAAVIALCDKYQSRIDAPPGQHRRFIERVRAAAAEGTD